MSFSFPRFYVYFIASFFTLSFIFNDFKYSFEYLDILITAILLISIIGYANKVKVFNYKFWKVYVPLSFIWDIYIRFISYPLYKSSSEDYLIYMIADIIIIIIPMYYMAFKYAFSNSYQEIIKFR